VHGCHAPVAKNDYVYTVQEATVRLQRKDVCLVGAVLVLGLVGCSEKANPRVEALNQDAALVGDLPLNPLKDKVITSWIDKKTATMSTLFGNDIAVKSARTSPETRYPTGAVLSVVTSAQQEGLRGNNPKPTKAVEFVTVTGPDAFTYSRYEGSPLKKVEFTNFDSLDASVQRGAYLLRQRAAGMP
jgi:hypothetical protein